MTMLDLYLDAVRKQLPRNDRDDIAAELRAVLLSQIEAEQAERGRSLTDEDVAAILKRYGAPEAVAASYGARRHLIGPQVYGHYMFAVKLVLWIVGAATLVMAGAALTSDQPAAGIARALGVGALVAFGNLTLVTFIFARIDRLNAPLPSPADWDPRDLPVGPQMRTSIPAAEARTSLFMMAFWLLWWTDVLPINKWLVWNRAPLAPAPGWDDLTPVIVGLMLASIIVDAIALLRPQAVKFYEGAGMVIELAALGVLVKALQFRTFVEVTDPSSSYAGLAGVLNGVIFFGLIAWALILIVSVAFTVRRWLVTRPGLKTRAYTL
jgi:hypothetical protein